MEKRKVIGVPAYRSIKADSFGIGITHATFLSEFGDIRIIMPHEDTVPVDMLYLPGGADVNPVNYGELPGFYTSNSDVFKEYFFNYKLKGYIDNKTPIFGVCMGMQLLAVHFGCKLKQHLRFHPTTEERGVGAHSVVNILEGGEFDVNSHHHQAVMYHTGFNHEVLEPLCVFDDPAEGNIVEAFRHRSLPIIGIQWHPKFFGAN